MCNRLYKFSKHFLPRGLTLFLNLFISSLLCFFIFSCKQNQIGRELEISDEMLRASQIKTQKIHQWFYFSGNSFYETEHPSAVPRLIKKPWTETERISSSLSIRNDKRDYDLFFTVNKVGILIAKPGHPKQAILASDQQLFSQLTAGALVCIDNFPVFHTYKNSFFSRLTEKKEKLPFLVQFHPGTSIFLPLLYTSDLGISDATEVTDLQYAKGFWIAALKTESSEETQFDYLNFFSYEPITRQSAAKRSLHLEKKQLSTAEYREFLSPLPFSNAPKRLQDLYKKLPPDYPFYCMVSETNAGSSLSYLNGSISDEKLIASNALIADSFSLAVFADGTSFFVGALPNKNILNQGEPLAFRLPRLPEHFSYGDFGVSGSTLYIAWEESFFYETARSGFLTVDLEELLYYAQ